MGGEVVRFGLSARNHLLGMELSFRNTLGFLRELLYELVFPLGRAQFFRLTFLDKPVKYL